MEAEEGKLTGLGVGDTEGTEAEKEDEDEGVERIGAVIPVVGGVGWERAGERGGHFSSSKGESLSGDALSSESTLHPDWAALLRDLEPATQRLGEVFLR